MSRQWYSGPPPSIGWWPASKVEDYGCLRWWNGSEWSVSCYAHYSPDMAAQTAKIKVMNDPIRWAVRPLSWPARSMT